MQIVLVYVLFVLIWLTAANALASDFSINSDLDFPDASPGDGICETAADWGGVCTLRAAIQEANANSNLDLIKIADTQSIALTTWLPKIVQPLKIRTRLGTGEPGLTIAPGQNLIASGITGCEDSTISLSGTGVGLVANATNVTIDGVRLGAFPCVGILALRASQFELSNSQIGVTDDSTAGAFESWPANSNTIASGVLVDSSPGANVHDNIVVCAGSAGIQVQDDAGRPAGVPALSPNRNDFDVIITNNFINQNRSGKVLYVASRPCVGGIGLLGANTKNAYVNSNYIVAARTAVRVDSSSRNTIHNNKIGPNTRPPANVSDARQVFRGIIIIKASENLISANEIGGAEDGAIELIGATTERNEISANKLGLREGHPVQNKVGILIRDQAHDNVVGYLKNDPETIKACSTSGSKCNEITNSQFAGVWIVGEKAFVLPDGGGFSLPAGTGNVVRGNSIYLNGGMGIDVGLPGVGTDRKLFTNYVQYKANGRWPSPPVAVTTTVVPKANLKPDYITVSGILFDRLQPDIVEKVRSGKVVLDVYKLNNPRPPLAQSSDLSGDGLMRPGANWGSAVNKWTVPTSSLFASSTYGEGRTWVGTISPFRVDPDGRFRMTSYSIPANYAEGDDVGPFAATMTDERGTSEFSAICVKTDFADPKATSDTDGDSLCDEWEEFGLDVDGDGTADQELNRGSRLHKDLYVEVDAIDVPGPSFTDPKGSYFRLPQSLGGLDEVVRSFAAANVSNPDNKDGVNLILDIQLGGNDKISRIPILAPNSRTEDKQYENEIKAALVKIRDTMQQTSLHVQCRGFFGSFGDRRRADCQTRLLARFATFRYFIFAELLMPVGRGLVEVSGITVASNLFTVATPRNQLNKVGTCIYPFGCAAIVQAGVFMHEMGHALGLTSYWDSILMMKLATTDQTI